MPKIPENMPEVPDLYGNAPVGEHEATFVGASLHPFGKGKRLVAKFLCLTPDRTQALELDGAAACAVAVCNESEGTNPKSKPFKIRQAMLEANEFDPIESAIRVPAWKHFLMKKKDGSRRCLGVRVRIKNAANDQISLVSHIRRPRVGALAGCKPTSSLIEFPQAAQRTRAYCRTSRTANSSSRESGRTRSPTSLRTSFAAN